MSNRRTFKAPTLLAITGVFVVTACTFQLRGEGESPPRPEAESMIDATGSELARCRGVTAEETEGYQRCRQVWAENRRRFFGKRNGSQDSSKGGAAAGPVSAPKDQSRVPQGYPRLTIPEESRP